uniref:Peroxidase n=1 Tax=Sedum alfredii TaxID=439688 RepID=A0A650AVG5_9MAGN|nr:Peroxidase 60 [Sedum alfredii]
MAAFLRLCALVILVFSLVATSISADLNANYYKKTCPKALSTIKTVVEKAVAKEKRMGASLLRLHFHDCFVNGCDASVLLDDSSSIDSEKNAFPNINSARGFNVVDEIKSAVDKACGRPVVSCADILAVAARDSVVALGGKSWNVRLGRRDSRTANRTRANTNLPSPFLDLPGLLTSFKNHGLNEKDLVALSGGHTIGFSQCGNFKNRIYNESTIDPNFARTRQATCPRTGGDTRLAPFDATGNKFDTDYFKELVKRRGLLHSDQALFVNGASTKDLVKKYSGDRALFFADFGKSMIKMGNITPLTGKNGEIRKNCRKVNSG